MPWITRDSVTGKITSQSGMEIEGVSEEYIEEAHPDFIEFQGKDLSGILSKVYDSIETAMHAKFDEGILWAFNVGETQYGISLNAGMRETLTTFERLIAKGHTNPHHGYLMSKGVEIRKPDEGDLSDEAIDEIATFAGLWVLSASDIAITEKKDSAELTLPELQTYLDDEEAKNIDWTVTWDAQDHPDWSDNLVLKNP